MVTHAIKQFPLHNEKSSADCSAELFVLGRALLETESNVCGVERVDRLV